MAPPTAGHGHLMLGFELLLVLTAQAVEPGVDILTIVLLDLA